MISIIIPTLNEEKILEKTLKQFRDHFSLPHEIIISDGKSTDRTIKIAGQYTDKIFVYDGTARQTIGQGRNAGAALAQGDFLVFLDADCSINQPDQFFKRALAQFENNPHLVGLTARLVVLPEQETFLDKVIFYIAALNFFILNNIFRRGAASGEFQMMRADAFSRVHGYREHLVVSEDIDMFSRLSKIGRTKIDLGLIVYHTGRRAHKLGWHRLLFFWITNMIWMWFTDSSIVSEWMEVR